MAHLGACVLGEIIAVITLKTEERNCVMYSSYVVSSIVFINASSAVSEVCLLLSPISSYLALKQSLRFCCTSQVAQLDQGIRDMVGTWLLKLTLKELYDWRFMQTDPNWGNFLFDQERGVLNLIDFGAAKEYPKG